MSTADHIMLWYSVISKFVDGQIWGIGALYFKTHVLNAQAFCIFELHIPCFLSI